MAVPGNRLPFACHSVQRTGQRRCDRRFCHNFSIFEPRQLAPGRTSTFGVTRTSLSDRARGVRPDGGYQQHGELLRPRDARLGLATRSDTTPRPPVRAAARFSGMLFASNISEPAPSAPRRRTLPAHPNHSATIFGDTADRFPVLSGDAAAYGGVITAPPQDALGVWTVRRELTNTEGLDDALPSVEQAPFECLRVRATVSRSTGRAVRERLGRDYRWSAAAQELPPSSPRAPPELPPSRPSPAAAKKAAKKTVASCVSIYK